MANGSNYCAVTTKAHIISWKGYSPFTGPGHCEYAIGVAMQNKSPWETVTLKISYQGSSLQVSSTSNMTPTYFDKKQGYITAQDLNPL